jgi:hypothetical protein
MSTDFLEIFKYTLPSVIVFITVYFLLKTYLSHMLQLEVQKHRRESNKESLYLKLQAYERIAMFCERISLDHLYYRLYHADMGVAELRNAMLIAVQQEYEHNVTQQIYISENLWSIVKIAKDQTQDIISRSEGHTPADFFNDLKKSSTSMKIDPINYAKQAVKSEVDVLLPK